MTSRRTMRTDERAVSPVIGVILMTSITVILAATIGSFVLGLGSKVTGTPAPQASFDFEAVDANEDGDIEELKITHNGGSPIDGDRLRLRGDINDPTMWDGEQVVSGDTITYTINAPFNGDTVRVIWMSPGDKASETLAEYTVPS